LHALHSLVFALCIGGKAFHLGLSVLLSVSMLCCARTLWNGTEDQVGAVTLLRGLLFAMQVLFLRCAYFLVCCCWDAVVCCLSCIYYEAISTGNGHGIQEAVPGMLWEIHLTG
jgi:hypothetical protein